MPRQLKKEAWVEIRRLFIAGWSIRRLAKRFGIPAGTIGPRAAKEHWANDRVNRKTVAENPISDDPEFGSIQIIVRELKLQALIDEAKTAQLLARKAAKAAETLEITDLEGIAQAQAYRAALWPAPSSPAGMQPARSGVWHLSPETRNYVEELKRLM